MSDGEWTGGLGYYNDGTPMYEGHFLDGKPNDLPDGTAAVRGWNPDGSPEYEGHYIDGLLHDLPDGTAAQRWWNPDGSRYERHYRNGVLRRGTGGDEMSDGEWTVERGYYDEDTIEYEYNRIDGLLCDTPDGTAAVRWWHPNGAPMYECRFRNGELHDIPDGTAASRGWYPDGSPEYERHYINGVLVEAQEETK